MGGRCIALHCILVCCSMQFLCHGAPSTDQCSQGLATPLFLAAGMNHVEICRLLLSRGAHVDLPRNVRATQRVFVFVMPIRRVHPESKWNPVPATGNFFAPVLSPQGGFTPLAATAQKGHTKACELLVNHGADVNACSTTVSSKTCIRTAMQYNASCLHAICLMVA